VKRTAFKKPDRPAKVPAILRPLAQPVNVARISGEVVTVAKEEPLRSEAYRRLVAAMPCAHCHKPRHSQHAHENECKGKAQKLDDRRAMPLCADEPGREGCHTKFDQYRLLPGGRRGHVAMGNYWAAQTRAAILEAGTWPKNLPLLAECVQLLEES